MEAPFAGNGGSIVNMASITWHGGRSEMAPYVATRGGIVAMTRALATELGQHEIRVNTIAPGAFPTAAEHAQHADLAAYEARVLESQALPRWGAFEELAAAVSFPAGPESCSSPVRHSMLTAAGSCPSGRPVEDEPRRSPMHIGDFRPY